ncbi:MAG: hypothetical protein QM640_01770, partial [Niabella sp.]
KKWLITRDALQKNHTGTAITLYFNAVDELLSDHKKLCSFFSEPKMFGMLFNSLWEAHNDDRAVFSKRMITEYSPKKVLLKKEDDTETGAFYFENEYLSEGYFNTDTIQYDLLWLGKKKIQ